MRQILRVGKGFVAISGRCRYKSRRNKEKDLETVENRPNFAASNENNNNLKMNNMKQFISSFIAATLIISDKPLNTNDIAVRLFKDKGFTWGGDEPNGNPNYFSK